MQFIFVHKLSQAFVKAGMICVIHTYDQQDATVYDNLLFLGCSTCFERYFRSSPGASKLYYSFWYYAV